jgi:hypothetical protein
MSKMIDEIEAEKYPFDVPFSITNDYRMGYNRALCVAEKIIRKYQPEPQRVDELAWILPDSLLKFLCGEADYHGIGFGEKGDNRGQYWWRNDLRKLRPYLQTNTAEIEKVREALEFIEKVAYSQYENDEKLRNRGARTLRRIGDRAKEALAIVNRMLGKGE